MNLATLPLDKIDYDAVLRFCEEQHEEGLDLDYKSDYPNDLTRILCAFANTQGGVVLIGVGEKGRRPECG